MLNALGEEVGFAEPPIPDGEGGFVDSVMLTESGGHFGRPEATIEQMMAEVFGGSQKSDKPLKSVAAKPKQLRFTNRREVAVLGQRNRYNPCSVCRKPTRSLNAARVPLCGKCSRS